MHATKARLIEATASLMGDTGELNLTLNDLLHATGVSKGSVYHFFDDFDDLLEQAYLLRFAEGVRASTLQLRAIVDEATDAEDFFARLDAVTASTQARVRAGLRFERARTLAMAQNSLRFKAALGAVQQELTDALAEVFVQAQGKGWVRTDVKPRTGAVFIQAYTLGRIVDDVTPEPMDDGDWERLIAEVARKTFRIQEG